jgi:gas vesicle protein
MSDNGMEEDRDMYENSGQGYGVQQGAAFGMTGFLAGALFGAAAALLLAPASGAETRQRLGGAAKRVGSTVKDRIGDARETLQGIGEDARTAYEKGREGVAQRHQGMETPSRTKSV